MMSFADWCQTDDAVELTDRFQLVVQEAGKLVVGEDFPTFVDEEHHRRAVHHAFDAMENVTQRRRADIVVVEHLRHVETENAIRRRPGVHPIVKQPAARFRPYFEARAQILLPQTLGASQQLRHVGETPLPHRNAENLFDRALDDLDLLRAEIGAVARTHHEFDQVFEKLSVLRASLELQGIEARRRPGEREPRSFPPSPE